MSAISGATGVNTPYQTAWTNSQQTVGTAGSLAQWNPQPAIGTTGSQTWNLVQGSAHHHHHHHHHGSKGTVGSTASSLSTLTSDPIGASDLSSGQSTVSTLA